MRQLEDVHHPVNRCCMIYAHVKDATYAEPYAIVLCVSVQVSWFLLKNNYVLLPAPKKSAAQCMTNRRACSLQGKNAM